MSYIQSLSWFKDMEKYDETTISLLMELSSPQFKYRRLSTLFNKLNIQPYVLQSIIKNLVSDGVLYMKNDNAGSVIVGLVDKKDILPSVLVSHRIDDSIVNSIVIEAVPKDYSNTIINFIQKITKSMSTNQCKKIINAGSHEWYDTMGRKNKIEISDTILIPS